MSNKRYCGLLLLVLLAPALAGCEQSTTQPASSQPGGPQPQSLPTISLLIGGRTFNIEVASTDQTREIGLMHRDSMPADHGMLFVFPTEQPLSFWMKNTRIPLEIVYLDHTGKIVSIRSMRPYDLTGIDSGQPSKCAIELNPGSAAAAGARPGDVVKIPPEISAAAR